MEWINVWEKHPENGQKVLGYFQEFDSMEVYTYKNVAHEDDGIFGTHCFYNRSGFLTDDIVYWMPLPENPPKIEYEIEDCTDDN